MGGAGFQYALTGGAFAGMWCINSFGGDYREYIQVKLDSVLQTDSCYYVEFYCNMANASYYAINGMAALLSNTAVSTVGPSTWGLVLQYTPQIKADTFLTDTLNWMKVAGYYQALGGEQYITIGNFDLDDPADTLQMPAGTYPGAYYYVDDVMVMKVPGCDTVGVGIQEITSQQEFFLYPNPNDGNMTFEYSLNETSSGMFMLYDVTGRLINTYKLMNGQNNSLQISENELKNGIYFYDVVVDGKTQGRNKIVIVK